MTKLHAYSALHCVASLHQGERGPKSHWPNGLSVFQCNSDTSNFTQNYLDNDGIQRAKTNNLDEIPPILMSDMNLYMVKQFGFKHSDFEQLCYCTTIALSYTECYPSIGRPIGYSGPLGVLVSGSTQSWVDHRHLVLGGSPCG